MTAPVLVVDGLGVKRGGRRVLDGLSLTAGPGEIVGIVGGNGCGKTTLLAAVAGVLAPDRGGVTIDGASVWGPERERIAARRALGYVPEGADPPGHLTGDELLALVAAVKGAPPLDSEVRTRLDLGALAAARIDRMSLGQRRRACLGAALVGAPRLLVLDEPDNGLDAGGIDALVELLAARAAAGAAALVASHDAHFLDRIKARRLSVARGQAVVQVVDLTRDQTQARDLS